MVGKGLIAALVLAFASAPVRAGPDDAVNTGCEAAMRATSEAALAEIQKRFEDVAPVVRCVQMRLRQLYVERDAERIRPQPSTGSAEPNIPGDDAARLVQHSYTIWPRGTLKPYEPVRQGMPGGVLNCMEIGGGARKCELRPR